MKVIQTRMLACKPIETSFLFMPFMLFCVVVFCNCHSSKYGKTRFNNSIKAPVAINLLDANKLLTIQIPDAKITLTDDGGQVVTPNNLSFSSLQISGGAFSLGLKHGAQFSAANPYRFALKVEATGYCTNQRTIIISNDTAQYIPIFMVKIDDPPAGTFAVAGNVPLDNSSIQKSFVISPEISNTQKRKVSVNFEKGTVLTSYGKKIDGKTISYSFSYASPTSLATLRTFPGSAGGTLVSDVVGNNGEAIATPAKPIFFTSAGWVTLEMKSQNQNVTGFSKAARLVMPIADSLINPTTLQPYKAEDKIEMWSLDERSVWKNEGIAIVQPSDDGLIATLNIKHITPWNLDYHGSDVCPTTTISYCNQLTAAAATMPLWCEIYQTQPGSSGTRFTSCGAGGRALDFNVCPSTPCTSCGGIIAAPGSQTILNGFNNREAAFVVYNSTSGPTAATLASSIFTFCVTPTPPTLIIPSGTLHSVNIKIQKGGTAIVNNTVFFLNNTSSCSTPTSGAYNYGGNLVAGETILYNTTGDFTATDIRIADGAVIAGHPTLQTYDFVFDLTPGHPIQTRPLMIDCGNTTTLVECRWFAGPSQFLISIP